jgi:Asp-tRNA(Asn)/Glu-tRNA(Gln) amidotransferase A subunit family amidase
MLAGEVSCRGLVETYLQRINWFDRAGPELGAIVSVCDGAVGRARELDEELARTGRLSGPLHGIPLLVKDCIETVDAPTTFGSIATGHHRPRTDAEVVRRLRAAGGVILAKTAMCDFAAGWFSHSSLSGDTKNPYALERDSGGSSAGSAAGVAANLATAAIGTDCGGSIRVPASFCNLVGLRTTPGVTSHAGTLALIAEQDTIGPLTRTVADAARLLSVLADEGTPARSGAAAYESAVTDAARGLHDMRIGVVRAAFGVGRLEAEAVSGVVMQGLSTLAAGGATLVEVAIPNLRSELEATSIYGLCSRHDIDQFLAVRPELPVRSLREVRARGLYDRRLDLIDVIARGPETPDGDPEYRRRQAAREAFSGSVAEVMEHDRLDALAYPSVQVLAPVRGESSEWTTLTFPTNTIIASQASLPAISLPAGFTASGFPVGLELMAREHEEPLLLRLGAAFERLAGQRRSPASAPERAGSSARD